MRAVHAALAFAVEIAMLVALGVWGFWASTGWTGWLLAIGSIAVVIVIWARYLSPRAARPPAPRDALWMKVGLFVGSSVLVTIAGHAGFGAALALCAAASLALERVVGRTVVDA